MANNGSETGWKLLLDIIMNDTVGVFDLAYRRGFDLKGPGGKKGTIKVTSPQCLWSGGQRRVVIPHGIYRSCVGIQGFFEEITDFRAPPLQISRALLVSTHCIYDVKIFDFEKSSYCAHMMDSHSSWTAQKNRHSSSGGCKIKPFFSNIGICCIWAY